MTHSRWNSLGRRGVQLAIVLVAASAAFAASPARTPAPSTSACPNLGQMTVTAPRLPRRAVLIAELGSMTVTAERQALVADLGAMTVTASRPQLVAHLGSMTVTAPRQEVMAHNAQPRATQAAF